MLPRAAWALLAGSALLGAGFGCSTPATSSAAVTDTAGGDAAAGDLAPGDAAGDAAAATADTLADTQVSDGTAADAAGSDAATTDAAQDTAAPAAVPLDQIADKFLEAICTAMTSCGGKTFATKQGCMAFLNVQMGAEGDGPGAMVALVKAGKATYDAVAAGKCLALYSSCAMIQSNKAPGECSKVFVGVAADGATCGQDEECKSLYCAKSDTQNWDCPGKCTAKVAAGAPCTSDDGCQGDLLCLEDKCTASGGKAGAPCVTGSCADGLFCDSSAEKSICAAKEDAGKACSSEDGCKAGLFCGPNSGGDGASCQAPAKVGAACAGGGSGSGGFGSDMFGTAPSPCEGGGLCAPTGTPGKFVCLAPAALGAACTHPQQCGGMDVECAGMTTSEPGKCQLLPGKGQTCTPPDLMKGILFTCQLPLVCDAKALVCSDPPTAGQPCLFMCAPSLSCSNGVCQGKAKEGESCENADCIKGTQCDNGKCVKVICQ